MRTAFQQDVRQVPSSLILIPVSPSDRDLYKAGEPRDALRPTTGVISHQTHDKFSHGKRLCAEQGWSQAKAVASRVYDCFPMNSELDMLEVRLSEMDDVVDYFVIVESKVSYTNHPKPLYYKAAADSFRQFAAKIIYVELESLEGETAWDREHYQRNCLFTYGLHRKGQEVRSGDIVIMSDLDEIAKPAWVAALKLCTGYAPQLTLEAHWSLYSFDNEVQNVVWQKVKALEYNEDEEVIAETLRHRTDLQTLSDAAWHCSWCFANVSAFQEKLYSFSHEELAEPSITSELIATSVQSGVDIFHRDDVIIARSNDPDVPQFVTENLDRFGYMLSRNRKHAGFLDFPDA